VVGKRGIGGERWVSSCRGRGGGVVAARVKVGLVGGGEEGVDSIERCSRRVCTS